jgi:6-phosphogluconolactonase (cycloisomerase 2 family)
VDPTGRFAYVANIGANTITPYAIDRATGALTAGSPVSVPSPRGLVFSSTGRTLYASSYAADMTGSVAAMPVDPATGALGAVTTTPTGGRQTFALAMDPGGRWLLAVHSASNDARVLSVDPRSERLTAAGALVSCGTGPVAVTVSDRLVIGP